VPEQRLAGDPATAFISYSWDDEPHKEWVRGLAADLRADGVAVVLDQWELQPGDRLPAFMEAAVRDNDYVLVVCTPHYKERSDGRQGGVGYEGDIMTGELLSKGNQRKFIPILRRGDGAAALPSWLVGKYYVDLRDGSDSERAYQDLLTTLLGRRAAPPPLGSPPADKAGRTRRPKSSPQRPADAEGPIRIVGVIVDEVTEPRLDGTRGSALYRVPLRLSRRPSAEWAALFERIWDQPPQFSTMHRPGIVSVQGDRVILDGTTIEEVERHHRETLCLCSTRSIARLPSVRRRSAAARRQKASGASGIVVAWTRRPNDCGSTSSAGLR